MAKINKLDMINVLRSGLEAHLKEALTEVVVKTESAEFEKKVRETAKPIIEQLTLESIENLRDLTTLRDEIRVVFSWIEK